MLLSRHSVGTYLETSSQCNLSGNIWPQSSQLAETLLTDPGIKIVIASFYSLTIKTVSIPNLLDVAGQIPVILGACSWHVLTEETGNGFCWHGLHLARRDWFLHLSAADGLCGLLLLFVLVQGKKGTTNIRSIKKIKKH